MKIPGLLFIDTPGHEAFSSLRQRGCQVADICVLIVDITQGVQPQTIEVINTLKSCKVPFVVALTKFDLIKGFNQSLSMKQILEEVDQNRTLFATEFNDKMYKIIGQLGELGFNSDRYDKVKDFTQEILLIPVSSKYKIGISELLLFLSGLSQRYLEKALTLTVEGNGKATVIEVKDEKGFGRTLDVILYDGVIKKNDSIKIESSKGIIITKVKMLLKPRALTELRTSKEKFENVDSVSAALGFKIVANDIEHVGSGDEIEVISEVQARELKTNVDLSYTKSENGIIIKVDVDGSKEPIIQLSRKNDVEIHSVNSGALTKEDLLESNLLKSRNYKYGAVFVFNQKVASDVELYAQDLGIKIFSSKVIYKIFEEYVAWIKKEEERIKEETLKSITYPAEFKILSQHIFRKSSPLVCGVEVIDGLLKPDSKIIQNGKVIGTLKRVQDNGKDIKEAKKGQSIAVSIEDTSVDKVDLSKPLYTFINIYQRQAVKDYLTKDYPELIKKLDLIYSNMD